MRITNEQGKVKCIDAKGNIKWLSKYMIELSSVLKDYEITILEAPEPLLPIIETPTEKTIEDFTKAQLVDLLKGVEGWKVTDSKEVLFNLYTKNK